MFQLDHLKYSMSTTSQTQLWDVASSFRTLKALFKAMESQATAQQKENTCGISLDLGVDEDEPDGAPAYIEPELDHGWQDSTVYRYK